MTSLYFYSGLLLAGALAAGYVFVRLPLLRRLFVPSSLAGGLILLLLGPQVAGQHFPELQIPTPFYDIWAQLPTRMITLVFAALFLGKPVLSLPAMWRLAGPQVAFGQTIAWGHYVVGGLLVLTVLGPVFAMPPITAALLEVSFEGGHGTVAGMAPVFTALDFQAGRDLATGLATASLLSALACGLILINWGRRRGYLASDSPTRVARNRVYYHRIIRQLRAKGVSLRRTLTVRSLLLHCTLLAVGVGFGWLIHQAFLLLEAITWGRAGVTFFGYVPLFTFAMFGGMIAQVVWRLLGLTVVREVIDLLSTVTLTLLIMAAIGTMSLEFLSSNGSVFIILYVAGVVWMLAAFFLLARRMFRRYWFQNAVISFGQGMGMTATGLLFAQMVDPKQRTNAVVAFGYKQLLFEPFVGGGLVTAMAMPLILTLGLPLFTALCACIMVAWLLIGLLYFGRR